MHCRANPSGRNMKGNFIQSSNLTKKDHIQKVSDFYNN